MLLTRAAEAEAALGTELPSTALQEVAAAAAPAAEGAAATREAAEPEEAVEAAADMVMDQIVEEREREGDLHYRVAWRGGAPPAAESSASCSVPEHPVAHLSRPLALAL